MNGRTVEQISRKLKRKIVRITTYKHILVKDHSKRDLSTVYLLDTGRKFNIYAPNGQPIGMVDAVIFYQQETLNINWRTTTRAVITKFLEYEGPELNGKVIEEIARKSNRKFVRITDFNHKLITGDGAGKRDPNTVYLLDPGFRFSGYSGNERKEMDAKIYWQKRAMNLDWKTCTKARITKYLEEDGSDSECVVCFEDLPFRESLSCSQCNSKLCPVCTFKMGLTDDNVARVMNGNWIIGHQCPECRTKCTYDPREWWCQVMDRMDEFTGIQRKALSFAKENDANAREHMEQWAEGHPLKHFKEGVRVKLHGLKGRRKWNGRKARIIGKGVVKNGVYRVPVELIGKSNERALLKQTNMRTMEK